jgi:hypothetical protein
MAVCPFGDGTNKTEPVHGKKRPRVATAKVRVCSPSSVRRCSTKPFVETSSVVGHEQGGRRRSKAAAGMENSCARKGEGYFCIMRKCRAEDQMARARGDREMGLRE